MYRHTTTFVHRRQTPPSCIVAKPSHDHLRTSSPNAEPSMLTGTRRNHTRAHTQQEGEDSDYEPARPRAPAPELRPELTRWVDSVRQAGPGDTVRLATALRSGGGKAAGACGGELEAGEAVRLLPHVFRAFLSEECACTKLDLSVRRPA